ncbi:hypothetical protein BOTBODRAFT_37184 [Botryobasidium botryosum FD-172 SS1]|uniref:Uncharacterized protein n=1 Tax=Botryobasidium botryosum (strain FD-172 SS1) TaxID=930990 RepID=A0A067MCF2_BOTB1|nr:hypothetical protein BOTBODRAFT_37184 [Botryobasidium botryosum FD-172 SS1]
MDWDPAGDDKSMKGTGWGDPTATHRAPTNWRLLKRVQPLSEKAFDKLVLNYFERDSIKNVDISKIAPILGVPVPGFTTATLNLLPEVESETDVVSWIRQAPCSTVRDVLQHMDPAYKAWKFLPVVGSHSGRSDLAWLLRWKHEGQKRSIYRCSIEVKPPWVYAWLDLVEFTSIREYPIEISPEQRMNDEGLDKYQKLWCQIFDYVVAQGTHYFILSTYQGWVFGCFSEMYTAAWVTPPKRHDTRGPTIIQCLLYWIQSSMSAEGGFVIPEAPADAELPWDAVIYSSTRVQARKPPKPKVPRKLAKKGKGAKKMDSDSDDDDDDDDDEMQVDFPGDSDAMDTDDPDDGDYIPPPPKPRSRSRRSSLKSEKLRKLSLLLKSQEAEAARAASLVPPPLLSTSTSFHLLPQAGPSNAFTPGGDSANVTMHMAGQEETAGDIEHASFANFGLDRMRAPPPLQFPNPFFAPE